MKEITIYTTVAVKVRVPDDRDEHDALEAVNECDYSFSIDNLSWGV